MLPIMKTPGEFDGAEFCFADLLKDKIEREVQLHAILYIYIYNYYIYIICIYGIYIFKGK